MRLSRPTALRILLAVAPVVQGAALGGAPASLGAQDAFVHARRFTVEDGLADNRVDALVQDRTGFVWAGTSRGLQRFDGYSFTRYAALDPRAPREFSAAIFGLLMDPRGGLVVAATRDPEASGSACCAFFATDSAVRHVTRLPLFGSVWTLDRAGRLWAIDGGMLMRITLDANPAAVDTIARSEDWRECSAMAVSGDTVWLALREDKPTRVIRLELRTGKISSFRTASVTLPSALREDSGRIWLSAEDGLELLDPGAERFRSLEAFRGLRPTNLEPDGHGGFLVATDYFLARVDAMGTVTERWRSPDVFGVGILPSRMALDREGGVWLASLTAGAIRLDLRRPPFEYRSSRSVPALPLGSDFIMALFERHDGTLWVGTLRGGAYRIAPDWTSVRAFRHNSRDTISLAADEVWDIEEDRRGNLWIGTTGGICRLTGTTFRCLRPPGLGHGSVAEIARDDGGWFWLAAPPLGVIAFNPETEQFAPPIGLSWTSRIAGAFVLFYDSTYLWIGMQDLFRVRVANGQVLGPVEKVRTLRSPYRLLFHIHRDRRGTLWIGSDMGLHRLSEDSTDGSFDPVDVRELQGTTVFSIAEDGKGRLWLGTTHGLVRFSPETGTAHRYGPSDGFRSGELNRRAALRRRNGEMLFGGVEGLTQFDPDSVTAPGSGAPVVLTRWRKVTASGPVEARIDGERSLRVEPTDRAFTIEFAAISFSPTVGRRYRYRVDGLNSDWVETTDHLATYSTPPPGRYVFRVQTAAGSEGRWSVGAAVTLDVIPPFWRTSWFRVLLALVAMALLWMAHRLRLRQALATERVRLQISRDLHDEIGAGLSSIALLSDSIGSAGGIADRDRSQLRRIADSARDMVADLRDIVWAIDPESDRLDDLLTRMKDVASDLLRDVEVSFRSPPASELTDKITMSARRDLLLLFKELMHNIARHSHATVVRIEFEARRGFLELTISDNGVGFEPTDVRTGTGLKSLRQRASRLGAELDISSERGRGTTTRLTLRST
jgi:signal transduction histidine kinase/ligand-binding sensor domain-containing protein